MITRLTTKRTGLAKDFGPLLVKSKTLFTRERRVNVDNLNDSDGVVKQDILDYVIGWNTPPPITRC